MTQVEGGDRWSALELRRSLRRYWPSLVKLGQTRWRVVVLDDPDGDAAGASDCGLNGHAD